MTQEQADQLGEFIRQQRERAGISLRELASRCAISPSNLSKIELGLVKEPSPAFLQRIARHLGCDYEDLAALAGYSLPDGLPTLPVYLRTKYGDLTGEEIRQLDGYLRFLRQQRQDQGKTPQEQDDDQPAG